MRWMLSLLCAASVGALLGGCTLKEEHVHESDTPARVERETVVVPAERETVIVPDDDVDAKAKIEADVDVDAD